MSREPDIAVVGGGLVGLSLAWGLAHAGLRVCVFDEGDAAVRATRGNFGLVWVQGKGLGLPAYAHWTLHSAQQWPAFAQALRAETGLDVGLQQGAGLHICLSDAEWAARAATLEAWRAQPGMPPVRARMLDAGELQAWAAGRITGLGSAVAGASLCEDDGHVNSLRLVRALLQALRGRGVALRAGDAVRSIEPDRTGFALHTASGTQRVPRVVLAAGNANQTLAPMVALASPMKPERGQILVTERVAPCLHVPLSTLRQTDDGSLLIGDSRSAGRTPDGLDTGINTVMAARALQVLPQLADVQVLRSWRAVRVMPADGFPIYAQSAQHPGAFVVGCHSGVTLAAAHARTLAPMIAAGALDTQRLDAFHPRRFDVPPPR